MSISVDIRKSCGSFTLESRFRSDSGVMGLLGPSGCGKTMTLQCISGILKPDSGRIEVNGRVLFDSDKKIDLSPQERHVGYLFQNYALFPNMTAWQNIECSLIGRARVARKRLSKEEKCETIGAVIRKMRLDGLENRKPSQLSGGQQQRVALARILIGDPELILMDEPMSALDNYLKEKLRLELMETLSGFGGDTLIVTHDRNEAFEMCDELAVMKDGRIVETGNAKALFASPSTRDAAVLTGCKNIAAAQRISEYEVFIPSWGITLKTAGPVREGLSAVGIRAHYFYPDETRNAYPVTVTETVEQPFEWIVKFRYPGQSPSSDPVWWRLPKSGRTRPEAAVLGVAPEDVLLLEG